MTDGIRPFELLCRAAEFLGATVCLTSTVDLRREGRRVFALREGARLRHVVVVIPAVAGSGMSRWERLQRGTVLAQAELADAVPLDEVAQQLAEELGQRIDQLRRRTA